MIAGRYSLEREIGRGGSGIVWLGRDEVLGRQVALKRIGLLPGADSTDLARAEREARLSARLNHAHVVGVFDVVTDPDTDGRWLVMEYVDGVNLGELVRMRGRLSPDEAGPLLWQAADALVAAAGSGIVHRDVKPSNILVDRAGRVKLTDFGIARISTDPSLTQTGMVTGSPAYLAPEVAMGGRGDEAADVWSLGATAFHVLAGRAPYEVGDNVLGALYRIVNEEPPRLEDAGWLGPMLEGTMVHDPTRRWTMAEVRDFLGDPAHPVPAREHGTQTLETLAAASSSRTPPPATIAPPPAAPSRRRRRPLLIAALVLVVLVGAAAAAYVGFTSGDQSSKGTATPTSGKSSATPSPSPSPTGPTAEGIDAFIRKYVKTVGEDPEKSWQMLTPGFQAESGGFSKYKAFWDPATNGRVVSITPDPDDLSVSYQVRFDNFDNGPGPTVLDLTYEDGRYLIAGERSEGFSPAG